MTEEDLIRKLLGIEALFAGAQTEGERQAAGMARERLLAKLKDFETRDPSVEYKFTLTSVWSKRLLVALLRRYGISAYRYSRQRRTTVMAKVPVSFVNETLWPEFTALNEALQEHLTEVTDRVIQSLHAGDAETEVREEKHLGPATS